ncbi:YhdP family protein [Parendozoicomonas sp. Alg238-R29]|uniref:YhdP family protein n=1 Tax=Parendozoicomonas sp. Alg238-R29 TaxID=2993446 RepID=UPI00248F093E|nr:YhdP family protein [Parendozoicomonas sp. Alg238-R29]
MRRIALHISRATKITLVFSVVLLALLSSAARFMLPMVDDLREQLRNQISSAVNSEVYLGELSGAVVNFNPAVGVSELVIYQPENPDVPSLTLTDIVLELDTVSTLMTMKPVFRRVVFGGGELRLDGRSGAIGLSGYPRKPQKDNDEAAKRTDVRGVIDLLSQQKQIDFRNFRVVFAMPSGEQSEITVQRIALSGPPEARKLAAIIETESNEQISLTLNIAGRAYNWPDVMVNGYVSLPSVNLKRWLPLLPEMLRDDGGIQVNQLRAGSELWFSYSPVGWDFRGQLRADMLDVDWKDQTIPPLTALKTDVALKFSREQPAQLWLSNLSFLFAGFPYPESNVFMEWKRKGDRSFTFAADKIHLQPLALSVHASNQLPDLLDQVVSTLAPRGRLSNLVMRAYPDRKPFDFDLAADMQSIGVDHWYGAPSGERITGSFRMNADSGVIDVNSAGFTLGLDNVFEDNWVYDRVAGRLYWRIVDDVYVLRSDGLSLTGGEGDIRTRLRLDIPFDGNKSIWMALEAGITDGDIAYTGKYLPVKGAMSDDLGSWLNSAVKGGDISQGAFIWNGPLDGPDIENDLSWGLFFDIADTSLAFDASWPELTGIDGLVSVDQDEVLVKADKAKIYNSRLSAMTARVPDLLSGKPLTINVKGQAASDGKDGLRILQETPIATAMGHGADDWNMSGKLGVNLDLDIPLTSGPEGDYKVAIKLNDNRLVIPEANIEGSHLNGDLFYSSAKGLDGKGLTGEVFGKPASFSLSTKTAGKSQTTLLDLRSRISMEALSFWLGRDFNDLVAGETDYRAQVSVGRTVKVDVTSDLVGVATTLPVPLDKAAKSKEPLKVSVNVVKDKPLNVTANLKRDVSVAMEIGEQHQLLRLGANFGSGKPKIPEKGVLVTGQLEELKLQPWVSWWEGFSATGLSTTSVSGNSLPGTQATTGSVLSSIEVESFDIKHLYWQEEIFTDSVVNVSRQNAAWELWLKALEIEGTAVIPDNNDPLSLDISHLDIASSFLLNHEVATDAQGNAVVEVAEADDVDPLLDVRPDSLPDMNVTIKNIQLGGKDFGHLSFNSRTVKHGLEASNVEGVLGGSNIDGSLQWMLKNNQHHTSINALFNSSDVENMLTQWGYPELMTGKQLDGNASLNWRGSPADFDIDDVIGDLSVDIREGRFLSVNAASPTGALRLFGVLNLDAITRRLRLDFSDLYSSGMAYDKVEGKLEFNNGLIVFSEPITVKGPSSDFRLGGQLHVPDRSLNMELVVTLPVTQNISVVSLLLGQPYIAGAAYLFDKFLGSTVEQFASLRYEIKGSFTEPEVKLDRLFSNKVKEKK